MNQSENNKEAFTTEDAHKKHCRSCHCPEENNKGLRERFKKEFGRVTFESLVLPFIASELSQARKERDEEWRKHLKVVTRGKYPDLDLIDKK